MPQTLSDWVTLIGMLLGFGGWYIEYRKAKKNGVNVDADTMTTYAALVDRAAKKEKEYQAIVDTFEGRIAGLETKVTEANTRADRFENWAKRLAGQVSMLGGTPVGLEQGKAAG
jgi:hypothetical protein